MATSDIYNLNSDSCLKCIKEIERISLEMKNLMSNNQKIDPDDWNKLLKDFAEMLPQWLVFGWLKNAEPKIDEKILKVGYKEYKSRYEKYEKEKKRTLEDFDKWKNNRILKELDTYAYSYIEKKGNIRIKYLYGNVATVLSNLSIIILEMGTLDEKGECELKTTLDRYDPSKNNKESFGGFPAFIFWIIIKKLKEKCGIEEAANKRFGIIVLDKKSTILLRNLLKLNFNKNISVDKLSRDDYERLTELYNKEYETSISQKDIEKVIIANLQTHVTGLPVDPIEDVIGPEIEKKYYITSVDDEEDIQHYKDLSESIAEYQQEVKDEEILDFPEMRNKTNQRVEEDVKFTDNSQSDNTERIRGELDGLTEISDRIESLGVFSEIINYIEKKGENRTVLWAFITRELIERDAMQSAIVWQNEKKKKPKDKPEINATTIKKVFSDDEAFDIFKENLRNISSYKMFVEYLNVEVINSYFQRKSLNDLELMTLVEYPYTKENFKKHKDKLIEYLGQKFPDYISKKDKKKTCKKGKIPNGNNC